MELYLGNSSICFSSSKIPSITSCLYSESLLSVNLKLNGKPLKDFILLVNDGSTDFSYWKANANAVDMNVNFDAGWGKGVQNVFCPAPANFVGYYPNSEREVRSIIDFSLKKVI